jgi:hypothetical protein
MRGHGSRVPFPDTPGARQKRAPPMIVGHLRRISPSMTHDHETAGQAAAGREETPGMKRAWADICDVMEQQFLTLSCQSSRTKRPTANGIICRQICQVREPASVHTGSSQLHENRPC